MQNTQIANYILFDLEQKRKIPLGFDVSSQIISELVDGWNKNVYVVPNQATKLCRREIKKYTLM
ncbi:MAG: hypothetical protein IJ738_01530 [Alphaproteobacteria bacterium]|nr:hypothetical protein [Alphaproteobacteria bacterium]MBR1756230.1 hypothetical protein [Alphaproteobacteria bacterium]